MEWYGNHAYKKITLLNMSRKCYSKNDNDNSKKNHCGNNSKIAHPILLSPRQLCGKVFQTLNVV